jgi:hypothetical protein
VRRQASAFHAEANGVVSYGQLMSSTADVAADRRFALTATASACFRELLRNQIFELLRDQISASLSKGSTVTAVTFAMQQPGYGYPDSAVAVGRGHARVTQSGTTTTLYFALVYIYRHRTESVISFSSPATPPTPTLQIRLASLIAKRIA